MAAYILPGFPVRSPPEAARCEPSARPCPQGASRSGVTRQYRGFAIPVGTKSVLFFKIGTHQKILWFCKVHVLKAGDLVLAQPSQDWSVSFSGSNRLAVWFRLILMPYLNPFTPPLSPPATLCCPDDLVPTRSPLARDPWNSVDCLLYDRPVRPDCREPTVSSPPPTRRHLLVAIHSNCLTTRTAVVTEVPTKT